MFKKTGANTFPLVNPLIRKLPFKFNCFKYFFVIRAAQMFRLSPNSNFTDCLSACWIIHRSRKYHFPFRNQINRLSWSNMQQFKVLYVISVSRLIKANIYASEKFYVKFILDQLRGLTFSKPNSSNRKKRSYKQDWTVLQRVLKDKSPLQESCISFN